MAGPAVAELLYLLDRAFDGDEEHSLPANLASVTPDDWAWKPAPGGRSIRAIAYHSGVAKRLYADHLSGPATPTYEGVLRAAPATKDPSEPGVVIAWLRDGHRALRDGIAALADDDLSIVRRTHFGEMFETRRIIAAVTAHDIYHAGEINHLRALRQGDDRWPWQPAT
ncbi:MAG: DinB family protein [Dehalococcoidia bacterium]